MRIHDGGRGGFTGHTEDNSMGAGEESSVGAGEDNPKGLGGYLCVGSGRVT